MSTEPTRAGGGDHPRFAIDDAFARRMVHTVAEAGEMARGMFAAGVKTWTKGNNSPVTEADMAVDAFLRQHLTALDPEHAFLNINFKFKQRHDKRIFIFLISLFLCVILS